jgi:hypothetical protein
VPSFWFPEFRAEEKYKAPAAETVLTAWEIVPSWKGDSAK